MFLSMDSYFCLGWVNSYPGGPEKAISDGVIIALNDVIDQYCPNLKKYLAENPDIDRMVKTDNGTYFAFPFIRGEDGLCYTVGSFIRKDWLDELGLEVPTTIDEWHDALLAFKEQKGAAAPLCYDNANFKYSNPFAFAYGVGWSSSKFILDDNGEVVYAPAQDGWKEYLTTMHQWYEEGLIDADFATLNGDQVTAKMTTDQAGASVGWAASRMQLFMTTAQQENPDYLLVPAPQPVLEKGATPQYGYKENNFPDVGAAITGSCKNVELAAKFLDYGTQRKATTCLTSVRKGFPTTGKAIPQFIRKPLPTTRTDGRSLRLLQNISVQTTTDLSYRI